MAEAVGRGKAADLAILSLAMVGAPYVLLHSAASALFLTLHGGANLPFVYLAVAALAALLVWGVPRLMARFDLRRLVVIVTLGRAAIAVGLKIGLGQGFADELTFVAAVWARVDLMLGAMMLWALLRQEFTATEAKRWLPIFAASEPAAILIVGALIPLMLAYIQPEDLFVVAAAAILMSLPPLVIAEVRADNPPQRPRETARAEKDTDAGRPLSAMLRCYLGALLGVVGVWTLTHYLLDNLFLSLALVYYPDLTALTGFIALALAASGALSLGLVALRPRRILRRIGMQGGLVGPPVALAALAALALALGQSAFGPAALFAVIVVMKVVERGLISGLATPSLQALRQPLPETRRARAKALLEGATRVAGAALAALGLIAASRWVGLTAGGLLVAYLALALIWTAAAGFAHRLYVAALERALQRRQTFDDMEIGASDRASREMVQRMIRDGDARDLVGAARMQAALDPSGFRNLAPRLIVRGERDVVLRLLTSVSEIAQPALFPPMSGRLSIEEDSDLRDALLTAAAATRHPNSPKLLAKALADAPDAPPMGALIGLGRDGGDYGAAVAGRFLERFALQSDAALRQSLDAIAAIGGAAPSGPVAMGLRSDNRGIRRAAIRAAGKLADGALAPLVAARLTDRRERRAATLALSSMGGAAVETLARTAGDREAPLSQRAAAIMALGGVDDAEAQAHVLRHVAANRIDLASAAHLALWRAGGVAPHEQAEALIAASRLMLRHAAAAALTRHALAKMDGDLFDAALTRATHRFAARAVRAAGLLRPRPAGRGARLASLFGEGRDHADAEALAPALLPPDLSPVFRALGAATDAHRARLHAFTDLPEGDAEDWLGYLLTEAPWANDWLVALSLRALATAHPEGAPKLIGMIDPPGPVTQDTIRSMTALHEGETEMALSTVEKVLILRAADLFSEAPDEDLAEIAPYLASVYLDPGDVVIREGEIGDELYILVSGEVSVERAGARLSVMGEGSVFGDLAALDPEPRAATVTATRPAHALVLSNEHLMALLESNVEISAGIIATLVRRLRKTEGY